MIRSILVPGLNSVCNPKALELSLKVARLFDGHIDCLHVHPDAQELARYTTNLGARAGAFSGQILESLIAGDKACASKSREIFEAFCVNECVNKTGAVTAAWQETEGNARDQIVTNSLYNDVVVFARPMPPEDLSSIGVGEVLVACGKPLILAPSTSCPNPLSTVVIAWKETPASARAVGAAMPLLTMAEKIHILGIVEDDGEEQRVIASTRRLATYLRHHGLRPQTGQIRAMDRSACDVLLEAATLELHAGLLVMGGYSHSRAREFIFGGFTRSVLHNAQLPVFVCH